MSTAFRSLASVARHAPVTRLATVARTAPAASAYLSSLQFVKPTTQKQIRTPLFRSSSMSLATKVERPISPHVTIYAFPVPALTSITNRVTGVGMTVGVMGMSFVALAGGCDIPSYVESVKTAAPILMPLLKMVVGFPLVYHTAAGVRHIFWDKTARGLDLPSVEMSSKALVAGSAVVTVILAFYTLPAIRS